MAVEARASGETGVDVRAARRARVVDTAREMFFALGYGGTAMSAVAARVGGSKTTLWNLFPSKQDLFIAVVDDLVERFGSALDNPLDPALPLVEGLATFARGMMGIVLSPPIIELRRLVVGEAGRFPELGRLYYERGPRRGKAKLAEYLAAAMEDGRVRRSDPERLARQFAALCQSHVHEHRLLGLADRTTAEEVVGDIAAAIESFVRAWGGAGGMERAR